jgi:hypothetical protein
MPDPDPASRRASVGSAVGLAFVAVVLVGLCTAGALGVVVTRTAAEDPAPEPERAAVASAQEAVPVRDQVVARFEELMLLREIALRERNPWLLESVYVQGAPGLARDRAEIERLRRSDRRLDGLRLPVEVVDADPLRDGRWLVVAELGRSPARLVTGSGRQVKAVKGSAAVYRCTLAKQDGRWLLLGLARS